MSNQILLIEDDLNLSQSITQFLIKENFKVHSIKQLVDADSAVATFQPQIILLDWMLPDGQGVDFLRSYRAQGGKTPVILLTARADVIDKVLGLETGANDYLTKPFEPRELLARIRVQLRPNQSVNHRHQVLAGPISIDLESRTVLVNGQETIVTKMEYELLKLFCENPNRVFSRDELLNKVWGYDSFPTTRTIDTHILQLRTKCGDIRFETIRGVGYRLKI